MTSVHILSGVPYFVCTAMLPWTPEHGSRAEHADATTVRDIDLGKFEYYAEKHCPNCGLTFRVLIPE